MNFKRILASVVLGVMALAASAAELPKRAVGAVAGYTARVGLALQANTVTNLIPLLYAALDVVSRELVGFIPAVSRDSSAERAALNQTVNIFVTPAASISDITPGVTAPNDGDQVIGNQTMTITKSKYAPVRWNGEEMLAVGQSGQRQNVIRDQFTQALRTLVNAVELDLANAAYQGASRSFGTAGTAPFGTASDLSDSAGVLRILDDNGAPQVDRQVVFGSGAMASLRGKQSVLFKVNEAGTDELLRQGILGRLQGLDVRYSGQVPTPAKGTGASYTTNSAGYAVGATAITLITGSGTILAGDTVTFAGDTNKYIVGTALAGGVVTLALPGLRVAIAASPTAITVGNQATQNVAFYRGAIQLATRTPAMPEGGDMADDVFDLVDPLSGLAFQVAVYRQYRQVRFEIGLAWGVKAVKAEHISVLLG